MIPFDEAVQLIEQTVRPLPPEAIPLERVAGRVLASDVTADIDSPPYDKSMMDGFALRSEDIADGVRRFDVIATIAAGDVPDCSVETGQCCRIMTGAPIPDGSDCVVVIEWTETREDEGRPVMTCEIPEGTPVPSGRHIIRLGENIQKDSRVFQTGQTVQPTATGLLAEIGASELQVFKRPRVAVIPTGSELVDCSRFPGPAQIRNSNGPMLQAMLQADGCSEVHDAGIVGDDEGALRAAIENGLQHDMLLLTGGVSMGQFDLVPGILCEAGVEQVFHKVKMKPGKPVWFGVRERNGQRCYVFGLPGNPVSSLVGYQLLVREALRMLGGGTGHQGKKVQAVLSTDHHARGDRPTFWPGKLVPDPDSPTRIVQPLSWRGSSDMSPLTETELLICFPAGTRLHQKDATVEAILI